MIQSQSNSGKSDDSVYILKVNEMILFVYKLIFTSFVHTYMIIRIRTRFK